MKQKTIIIVVIVVIMIGGYLLTRNTSVPTVKNTGTESVDTLTGPLKEFFMTAYYDATGKWFSVKEMSVKKGDHVRVKITNTAGMHDFTLDEFNIQKELPLNQEVLIDFTANKVGNFQYYCSKPGHREGGQWGTLKVSE